MRTISQDKALAIGYRLLAEFQANGLANLDGEAQGTRTLRAYIPDPLGKSTAVSGTGGELVLGAASINGFTWPGGSPDIGELPTNAIGGIAIRSTKLKDFVLNISDGEYYAKDFVTVSSKAALAARIFAGNDEFIFENQANGAVGRSYGGNDRITVSDSDHSSNRSFTIYAGSGNDDVSGGYFHTRNAIYGEAGNDTVSGGNLADRLYGGAGRDKLSGGQGNDLLDGGAGNDVLYGTNEFWSGNEADILRGGAGNDTLYGGRGNDKLYGGTGKDTLNGGAGKDVLNGGTGKDVFIFTALTDSTLAAAGRDTIEDFSRTQKDRIDLKEIDANTKLDGDQAFKFIGAKAFSKKAGELRYLKKSGDTYIYGDVDGDGKADFSVHVDASITFKASDFIL